VRQRLAIAVIRGLLVDVVSGADVADPTASLERFLTMWRATGRRQMT
jgi:hypothetical protein